MATVTQRVAAAIVSTRWMSTLVIVLAFAALSSPAFAAAGQAASSSAAWKTIPSWFLYGSKDQAAP